MGGFRDTNGALRQVLMQAYELETQDAYVGERAKPAVRLIADTMSPPLTTTLPSIAPPSKAVSFDTQSKKATVVANSRGTSAMRKDIK